MYVCVCARAAGRFSFEAFCSCGATISGPAGVAKIQAAKLDFFDEVLLGDDLQALAALSLVEGVVAKEEAEAWQGDAAEHGRTKREKRVKKAAWKQGRSQNDYSEFRNKDLRMTRSAFLNGVEAAEGGERGAVFSAVLKGGVNKSGRLSGRNDQSSSEDESEVPSDGDLISHNLSS